MTTKPEAGAVCAQNAPFPVQVKGGETYWWCRCGRSETQPFCDGSHAGTGLLPIEYTAPRDRTLFFCGCKATQNPPFCDGSHQTIEPG